jgi:hypothetical protein
MVWVNPSQKAKKKEKFKMNKILFFCRGPTLVQTVQSELVQDSYSRPSVG